MSRNYCGDDHENDLVMPGFRFHPTEEELIEFYLRRKVEGKRFNVELITFLDLYRYDPWELPALAAIGEKEWFFYVPRDRKYRNGDRPNRVSPTGYWKATGADRMIRGEDSRPIGLKRTLVFYSGKAPKGIRSRWIMNEYRLPQNETDHKFNHKAEISICRVCKRAGADDHYQLPGTLSSETSSSKQTSHGPEDPAAHQPPSALLPLAREYCTSSSHSSSARSSSKDNHPFYSTQTTSIVEGGATLIDINSMQGGISSRLASTANCYQHTASIMEDLSRVVVGYNQHSYNNNSPQLLPLPSQPPLLPMNMLPISDNLGEWNLLPDTRSDDIGTSFK